MFRPERHAGFLHFGHDLSRAGRGRKLDVERGGVLLVDLDALDAFELFDARLHLVRLGGLVAELLDELFGLFDHPLLVLVGGQLLRTPFGAQHDVFRVGHLVVVDLAQRQFDGACGDVVQKGAVVRNDEHGAVVAFQILLQPLDRLDVQMVGRFVQQEDRGASQQQFGQLDAHAPAARELGGGAAEIRPLETQSQQRLFDVGVARLAAEDVVVILRVVQPVQQRFVGGRFVVGALGDFARQGGDFGFECQHLFEGRCRLLDERRRVGDLHLLRQVAHRAFAVFGDRARRGLLLADDEFEQCGFARAVFAHQTDAVFGIDQKRDIIEQRPAAVTYREIIERNHG